MNDRSATTRSKRCAAQPPRTPCLRERARSAPRSATTRGIGSARADASWPWPTSTPTTCAAPRCSSTSLKPPRALADVEAGLAARRRCRQCASAASSLSPPRETKRSSASSVTRSRSRPAGPHRPCAARPSRAARASAPRRADQPLRGGTRRRDAAAHEQLVGTHRVEASRRFRSGVSSGSGPACTGPAFGTPMYAACSSVSSVSCAFELLQLQPRHLLVEVLRQHVDADRVLVACCVNSSICAIVWLANDELIT